MTTAVTAEPTIESLSPEQSREAIEAWRNEFRQMLARHPERQSNPQKAKDEVIAEIQRRTVADATTPGHAPAVPGHVAMHAPAMPHGAAGAPHQPGMPGVPGVPSLLDLERMGEVRGRINAMVDSLISKEFKSEVLRVNEKFATIDEYLNHLNIKLPKKVGNKQRKLYNRMGVAIQEGKDFLVKSGSSAVVSAVAGAGIGLLTGGASWAVIGAGIVGSTLARAGVSAFRIVDRLWSGGKEYKLRHAAAEEQVERGQKAVDQAHKVREAMRTYDADNSLANYHAYLAAAMLLTTQVEKNDAVESTDEYHTDGSKELADYQQKVNTVETWLAIAGGLYGGISKAHELAKAALTGGSVEAYAQAKLEAAKEKGTHLRHHFITWAQNGWHAVLHGGPHSEVAKGAAEAAKYGYEFTEIFKDFVHVPGAEGPISADALKPIHKFALDGASEQLLKQFGQDGLQKLYARWVELGAQAVGAALAGGGAGWLAGNRMIEGNNRTGAEDRLMRSATRATTPSLSTRLQDEARRWGHTPVVPQAPTAPGGHAPSPDGSGPQSVEVQVGQTFEIGDTYDRTRLGLGGDDFAVYRVAGKLPDGRIQLDIFKTVGGTVKEAPKAVTLAELEALVKDAVKQKQTVEQIALLKPFENTLTRPIEAALIANKVVQIQFKDAVADPALLTDIQPLLAKDVKYFVHALHTKQYIPTIELRYDVPGTGREAYQEVPMHQLFPYLKPKLEITDGAPTATPIPATAAGTPAGAPVIPGATAPVVTGPIVEPPEKEKAETILATRRANGELLVPTHFAEKLIVSLKTNPAHAAATGDAFRYAITSIGDKFIELKPLQWNGATYEREPAAAAAGARPPRGGAAPAPTAGKYLFHETLPVIPYTAFELAEYVEKGWGTAVM